MSNRGNRNVAESVQNETGSTESTETVVQETVAPAVEKKSYNVPQLFVDHKNKSGVIRFLSSEGLKTGEITKILQDGGVKSANGTPIRYQHVRNVLTQPVKKVEMA
jgi:glutaredoxin